MLGEREKQKEYYSEGIRLLLREGETHDNILQVLDEYKQAKVSRLESIAKLKNEKKIIKRLKIKS